MAASRSKTIKTSVDYRLWILFKYIYIGVADILFWWTVWGIADHIWPMDITKDGALSYIRGYFLIILANLAYLIQRYVFRNICRTFYETRRKYLYPSAIVTEEEVISDKPLKFILVKKTLVIMVWLLVVGYIQVWRGLFASFDYIVDLLYNHYSVNRVLSSVVFQLIVGVTLAFTQRNNAVNLCPTHKIYKYDELEELDGLFNLHIFDNFLNDDDDEDEDMNCASVEQALPSADHQRVTLRQKKKKAFKPLKADFDLPQYAAKKIAKNIHKSTSKNNIASKENTKDSVPHKSPATASEEPQFFVNSGTPGLVVNNNPLSRDTVELETEFFEKNTDPAANNNYINEGFQNDGEIVDLKNSPSTVDLIRYDGNVTDSNITPPMNTTNSIMQHLRRVSFSNLRPPKNMISSGDEKTKEVHNYQFDLNHCNMCRCVSVLAYLYTIHHRQVFLHIFGGMFWSTSWKLFDYASESILTKTASDIPVLALIAIFSHCLNHLVLFRFKETASGIHWKTFWEFFCGLFTVTLWAPTWYIFDIMADASGYRFEFQIGTHLLAFLSLAFFNVTMNLAL